MGRPAKTEERRRQVLDAAQQLFGRRGFHNTSIADISAETGMSPGHIYHYFANKEEIVSAIVEEDRRQASEALAAIAQETDVLAALLSAMDLHAMDGQRDGGMSDQLFLEVMAEAARNPRIAELVRRFDQEVVDLLAATLRLGQERGVIRSDLNAAAAAHILVGIFEGMSIRALVSPLATRSDVKKAMSEALRCFLAPTGGTQQG